MRGLKLLFNLYDYSCGVVIIIDGMLNWNIKCRLIILKEKIIYVFY